MPELPHERESYHRRLEDNIDEVYPHYRHEIAIQSLEKRTEVIETFIMDSKPSIAYIESVIKRNEERAEFYKKTAYNIAGWGIMGLLTFIGGVFVTVVWPALMVKVRQYLGGF
jgi:hypothetical protein